MVISLEPCRSFVHLLICSCVLHQGHTVGAAITGGMGGGQEPAPAQQEYSSQQQQPYYPTGGSAPCQLEMKQFIDCAQNQYDITLCQGFNEALRQCRISNGQCLLQF